MSELCDHSEIEIVSQDDSSSSGESELSLHAELFCTKTASKMRHGVLILHGFPSRDLEASRITSSLDALAERVVAQIECKALLLSMRGCGKSAGDFSLKGWVEDAQAGVNYLVEELGLSHVWIVGFGTGGAVGLVAAASSQFVEGVVTLGSPADFDDWYANPQDLIGFAEQVGAIKTNNFPEDVSAWQAELAEVKAVTAATEFGNRSLMVIHGSEDSIVPHFDARIIADAHGAADLRFISGGGHQLKHDPRAVAVLLGWLDREVILHGSIAALD